MLGALCFSFSAHAQSVSAPQPFVEEQRQQERERALREQQERSVDARIPADAKPAVALLSASENPCFVVDRLRLDGELSDDFDWSLAAAGGDAGKDSPLGRCLGAEGINTVVTRVQQAIVDRGYTTTRVLAGRQDLSNKVLTLTLIPGRVPSVRFADASVLPTTLRNAIPIKPGDLLNLRDIEQGLENLKRLPTVEADIQIEPSKAPGARPGDSDLVVKYSQKVPLRTTLSLDDTGTEATGKTQTGLTVAWDGPLGLNDLAYVSLNHDAFNHEGQGTSGQTVHYSVPFGYWLLGFNGSQSRYHQSVAGLSENYVYAGETRNAEVKLSRLIYRDQRRKTTVAIRGFRRASNNFIDDTEVEVQRRVVGGWEASLNHREFIGDATLDGTLAYRRGTGAFGALPAPEEFFGEGTSRLKLYTADVNLNAPFQLGSQKLRYTALWRTQWNRTPLTPQDRFSIGGRYTVRGFDGETSLMGERGWILRNDLGIALGQSGAELYAGVDYGEVGGPSTQYLLGRHLAGGAVGLRGAFKGLNYDLFVGAPISKPEGYRTAKVTGGVNFNYSF
ncbi:ShlB/FhaC/HecB family hemolysin secretion/activation protein [Variovorax ginsengisoli]|uniref:ShlB/FhaC/HecB family hemolysin secretion/activation protein n=1 Tax=Variovorax ginsengisoli TaxID=363844 RepID=UPI0027D8EB17|nr:ShlB/FhaC/HecB family hemolysin secretion/activation protein [Variovorax ginsengisoli]